MFQNPTPRLNPDQAVAIASWISEDVLVHGTAMRARLSERVLPSVEKPSSPPHPTLRPFSEATDKSFSLASSPSDALSPEYRSMEEVSVYSEGTTSEDSLWSTINSLPKPDPKQKCSPADIWPFEWHASKESNRVTEGPRERQQRMASPSSHPNKPLPRNQHVQRESVYRDAWHARIDRMLSLPFEAYPWQRNESILAILPRSQDLEECIQLYFSHFHDASLSWSTLEMLVLTRDSLGLSSTAQRSWCLMHRQSSLCL